MKLDLIYQKCRRLCCSCNVVFYLCNLAVGNWHIVPLTLYTAFKTKQHYIHPKAMQKPVGEASGRRPLAPERAGHDKKSSKQYE